MAMPAGLFALMLLLFAGCASTEQAKPAAEPQEPLSLSVCKPEEFGGVGVGTDEKEALSEARADLASQINSSVKVTIEHTLNQQILNEKENLSSKYKSRTTIEAALPNAHDARIARKSRTGGKINIAVCMSKSDAAKGFIERQRLIADSLELASTELKTEHPKRKSEAWQKTQLLWNEFARIQALLDGWGIEKTAYFGKANEIYSQAREEYKEYCQTSKLHWKPEKESEYSSIAFSVLSKNLKMEKSACKGSGILLAYKHSEPDCSYEFGLFNCFYKPSLSILSCDGTEYSALENVIESSHKKQELALEKIKDAFKAADFRVKWEMEIKEWSPKCE